MTVKLWTHLRVVVHLNQLTVPVFVPAERPGAWQGALQRNLSKFCSTQTIFDVWVS
jgi:hypothetical protein